jgi:hypothetical protein
LFYLSQVIIIWYDPTYPDVACTRPEIPTNSQKFILGTTMLLCGVFLFIFITLKISLKIKLSVLNAQLRNSNRNYEMIDISNYHHVSTEYDTNIISQDKLPLYEIKVSAVI